METISILCSGVNLSDGLKMHRKFRYNSLRKYEDANGSKRKSIKSTHGSATSNVNVRFKKKIILTKEKTVT